MSYPSMHGKRKSEIYVISYIITKNKKIHSNMHFFLLHWQCILNLAKILDCYV